MNIEPVLCEILHGSDQGMKWIVRAKKRGRFVYTKNLTRDFKWMTWNLQNQPNCYIFGVQSDSGYLYISVKSGKFKLTTENEEAPLESDPRVFEYFRSPRSQTSLLKHVLSNQYVSAERKGGRATNRLILTNEEENATDWHVR